jgi:catechol 2,3-dioxygenase-like lactoylglutathione lyase family enzyme
MSSTTTHFHLSLNVSDLPKSVEFYRTLFGCEPAKHRSDYAKFELEDPPVVLSLEPHPPAGQGTLNHVGLRLSDTRALVDMQRRLELAGLSSAREEGVECCYARQTKFWLRDPDHNLWEFYVLEGDLQHRGSGQTEVVTQPVEYGASTEPQPVAWEHRLGESFPLPLPLPAGGFPEVRLRGTFNSDLLDPAAVLSEVRRILAPGGQVLIHCLTAASEAPQPLELPGPAAVVKRAPVDAELLSALESAGFHAIELTKFGSGPCFQVEGIEMRETMLRAFQPVGDATGLRTVVYRGPFQEVVDEAGIVWRRGERREVSEAVWHLLRQSAFEPHFTCLQPRRTEVVSCTGIG